MYNRELLVRLSQERDKYSALSYILTKALKDIVENNNSRDEKPFESLEEVRKFIEDILKENNLLYK